MYADRDKPDYSTKYQNDYRPNDTRSHGREAPHLTMTFCNDIGSKVRSRQVQATGSRGLTAEMTATHFAISDNTAPDYLTANQRDYGYHSQASRNAVQQRVVPLENDTMHIIFPSHNARASGKDAHSISHTDYSPKALPRHPVDERHITVSQTNDIGTRLIRSTLNPSELMRSHWDVASAQAKSGPQERSLKSSAQISYSDPRRYSADREQLYTPGPSGSSSANARCRSQSPDGTGSRKWAGDIAHTAPAGNTSSLSHVGYDIITGRQRVMQHYMSYEHLMQKAHQRMIAGEAQRSQARPLNVTSGGSFSAMSHRRDDLQAAPQADINNGRPAAVRQQVSPQSLQYGGNVYVRSDVPIKSFNHPDPLQTGTDSPAYNIITGHVYGHAPQ